MLRILFILFLLFSFPAFAANKIGIVASVGDEAITSQDLIGRTKLTILTSGLKNDEDTAKKIAPKILQTIINEKLQLIDADSKGIKITDEEIENAVASIEKKNKLPAGQMKEILKQGNIQYSTIQQQVKAQIAWIKIKTKIIKPQVRVSDEEVDDFVKAQMMNLSQDEFRIMEIVLPVEDPKDEQKTAELASKLTQELQSGKDFGKLASQFSQSASAMNNGEVGWLAESQLPKEMLAEIHRIGVGVVSQPIRSIEGYFIIKVLETRKISSNDDESLVMLKQFSSQNVQNVLALNDPAKACIEPDSYAAKKGVSYKDQGIIKIRDLGEDLSSIVSRLDAGKFSPPLNLGNGASVLIVCEKTEDIDSGIDPEKRDRAQQVLSERKLDLASRKYLRDLRRTTNIEVKF